MSEILYTAAAGAVAQQMRLEIIANNLANTDSVGFKADAGRFRALMSNPDDLRATAVAADGARLTDSVHVVFDGSRTDYSQGRLKATGNDLDLAISGEGFFVVETPEGERYTRRGAFGLSPEGILVTSEGYPVTGDGGPVRIVGQQVMVAEDGRLTVDGVAAGRIRLVNFDRPYRLEKVGDALFRPVDETVTARDAEAPSVRLRQGFVETSNVDPIRMMTEMLEVLRVYESHQKMMRTAEETDGKLIAEVSRSA